MRAHGIQHLHGRNIEGVGQGLADRDRPAKILVEVLRSLVSETGRPILDQRLGMREASLESQTIDDGL